MRPKARRYPAQPTAATTTSGAADTVLRATQYNAVLQSVRENTGQI